MSDEKYKENEEFNQLYENCTLNLIEKNSKNIISKFPNYIDIESNQPEIEPFLHPENGIPNYEVFQSFIDYLSCDNKLNTFSDTINLSILHCCFFSLTITKEISDDYENILYDSLYIIHELINTKLLYIDEIMEEECINVINLIKNETKDSILSQCISLLNILMKFQKFEMFDELYNSCICIYHHFYEEEQTLICKNVIQLVMNAFLMLEFPDDNLMHFTDILFSSLDISKLEISEINLNCLVQLLDHFPNFSIQEHQLIKLFPFLELKNICFCSQCLQIILFCTSEESNLEIFQNLNIFSLISKLTLIIYPQIQVIVYSIFAKSSENSYDCCKICINLPLIQSTKLDSLTFNAKIQLHSLICNAINYKIIDQKNHLFDLFLSNFIENVHEFPSEILIQTLKCLLCINFEEVPDEFISQIHNIMDDNEDQIINSLCMELLSIYEKL